MLLTEEVTLAFAEIRASLSKVEKVVETAALAERSKLASALKEKEETAASQREALDLSITAREGQLAAESRLQKVEEKYDMVWDDLKRAEEEWKSAEAELKKVEQEKVVLESELRSLEAQLKQAEASRRQASPSIPRPKRKDKSDEKSGDNIKSRRPADTRKIESRVKPEQEKARSASPRVRSESVGREQQCLPKFKARKKNTEPERSATRSPSPSPEPLARRTTREKPRSQSPTKKHAEERGRSVSPPVTVRTSVQISSDATRSQQGIRANTGGSPDRTGDSRQVSGPTSPRVDLRKRASKPETRTQSPPPSRPQSAPEGESGGRREETTERKMDLSLAKCESEDRIEKTVDRKTERSRSPISRQERGVIGGGGAGGGKSGGKPGGASLCFFFIIGKCTKGESCPDRHPEKAGMAERMAKKNCRSGIDCKREDCMFKHPEGRAARLAASRPSNGSLLE